MAIGVQWAVFVCAVEDGGWGGGEQTTPPVQSEYDVSGVAYGLND